jgi:tRNA-splicing ligase RtcB (3'-phosphate/5'-hydroxy nucleic acid ligase)
VAATDVERGGEVSPGGVGFDISCCARLLKSNLTLDAITTVVSALQDRMAPASARYRR